MRNRSSAGDENDSRALTERIAERNVTVAFDDYFVSKLEILERSGEGAVFGSTPNSSHSSDEELDLVVEH